MAPQRLVLLLVLQAAASPPCAQLGVVYKDVEVPDVGPNGAWVLDAEQCQNSCEARPTCAFFSFVPSNLPGAGECWLLGKDAKAQKRKGVISGPQVCIEESAKSMSECATQHKCPTEWSRGGLGGFLCLTGQSVGACRQAAHGPFPTADCQAQCRIGSVDQQDAQEGAGQEEGGGKDDEQESEKEEKVEGHSEGEEKEATDEQHEVEECDHNYGCPSHWLLANSGGFHCASGSARGRCRDAHRGPFPRSTCEEQCSIGVVGKEVRDEIPKSDVLTTWLVDPAEPLKTWKPRTLVLLDDPSDEKELGLIQQLWKDEIPPTEIFKIHAVKPMVKDYPGSSLHVIVERNPLKGRNDVPVLLQIQSADSPRGHWQARFLASPVTPHGIKADLKAEGQALTDDDHIMVHSSHTAVPQIGPGSLVRVRKAKDSGNFSGSWMHKRMRRGDLPKEAEGRLEQAAQRLEEIEKTIDDVIKKHEKNEADKAAKQIQRQINDAPSSYQKVMPCLSDVGGNCPKEWSTGDQGGYFCPSHNGCRPAEHGAFPAEVCKDQCSLGHVFSGGGGGDVAVPFDCWLHLKSWKSHWNDAKKKWCCQNSVQGEVACEEESNDIQRCPKSLETSCPKEWTGLHAAGGGFYCHSHAGCRPAAQGPFPLESCKDQCYIGRATIGGFLPKPVYWDCGRDFLSWDTKWSQDKKEWCCRHFRGAHTVCKTSVKHTVVQCDAMTAGGVPCNFPFKWGNRSHYGCAVEDQWMRGRPWCIRVDGNMATCDCEVTTYTVEHISVSHEHPHPEHPADHHPHHPHDHPDDHPHHPHHPDDHPHHPHHPDHDPGDVEIVHPCFFEQNKWCPDEWQTSPAGGYFCHANNGCRPAAHGPFPAEDCKDQCSIGHVFVAGGGDVAVPFDCTRNLHSWHMWSGEKKAWCCKNSEEGQVACEKEDQDFGLRRCPEHVEPACPKDWPHSSGGFYCNDHGGCRPADDGPFPVETCEKQCYIGRPSIGGFIPKPVYWDCELHLNHWETHWTKEKQHWCCEHSGGAHVACSKTDDPKDDGCFGTTAGGVPCNFPFRWNGEDHYGCAVHHGFMGGRPWCMRVDGNWAACDCKEPEDKEDTLEEKFWNHADKGEFAGDLMAVLPCPSHMETGCPSEWLTSDAGGFFCHTHKGCRAADEGPFPEEDCQAQCSLGEIYIPGGGDVAVPFDCLRHLHSWRSKWSEAKRRWCCEHSEEGQVACGSEDGSSSSGHLRRCGEHVRTTCPSDWVDGSPGLGGWFCQAGVTAGGCREAQHGPFPLEDCKEQCYLGDVKLGGYIPKPLLWDCERHLNHWEHRWSQEKQLWCCTHDVFARQVCAHISVNHKVVTSCDATTAGGKPCDFPFHWNGKKHYSCVVDKPHMGGNPWCMRVDGTWADCDCHGFGSHVISVDVTHVHKTYPFHHMDLGKVPEHLDWKPEGVTEGIHTKFDCTKKVPAWTETKKQWCCEIAADCTANVTHFDCLADLAGWEKSWSLEKKVWCWTLDGVHELFDCDAKTESWSADQQDWCCRNKHKGCEATYDCDDELQSWESSWNMTKKKWCWNHEHKGFFRPFKCEGNFQEQTTWPREKQEWCCKSAHKGCMGDFDCKENLATWQVQWTTEQKHYCCQKEGKGCYDCNAGLRNWERGWSDKKKSYCCTKEQKGCFSCLEVSQSYEWKPEHREYCCSANNVACHDCRGDVLQFEGEKKEWCCENERRCHPSLTTSTTLSTTNCPEAITSDNPMYCNTPIGTWPPQKREFCCKHYKRGCKDKEFKCDEDLHNVDWAWSSRKKEWCCVNEHKGCPKTPNCRTAPSSWSQKKREFCCHHYHVGCSPYECHDGSHPSSWTHSRRSWCCTHADVGCPHVHPPHVTHVAHWVHHHWHHHNGCSAMCHFGGEVHSCGDRIKYAAAHRFANQRHACVAAHHLVAGECDHCSHCTVEMSGCYVFWQRGPASHVITKHSVTVVHHAYHCHDEMVHLWSSEKKHYCCVREAKGCPPHLEAPETGYDCNLDFAEWEIKWDAVQKSWCCKHQQKACARFQCDLHLADFQTHWGPPKKVWCCQHEHRGCVPGFQWFDCLEDAVNWEQTWTAEKKGWCCSHEKKGCPGWTWHPPPATPNVHVTHTTYVTHHVHHGGHWEVGFDTHHHHGGGFHVHHGHFDCHAALEQWEDRWAPEKKTWCWHHFHLGFGEEFNCHLGQAHLWSDAKQNWCCTQKNICHGSHHRGIHHIVHAAFDCHAALGNWERAWSPAKKSWCWMHEHLGGPPGSKPPAPKAPSGPPAPPALPQPHFEFQRPHAWGAAGVLPGATVPGGPGGPGGPGQFDCAAAVGNWEIAWSPSKKHWCWTNEKKGGPELFNCYATIPAWSVSKRSWCCVHHKGTCPDRRLSEPEIFA